MRERVRKVAEQQEQQLVLPLPVPRSTSRRSCSSRPSRPQMKSGR